MKSSSSSPVSPWFWTAEEKIKEAMEAGEFKNLPGSGKPLVFEDESHVPLELRLTYRMLKRAGVAPEEVLAGKNLAVLRAKLLNDPSLSDSERRELKRKIISMDLEANMKLERFRKQYSGL
jgi:hypothetical protein